MLGAKRLGRALIKCITSSFDVHVIATGRRRETLEEIEKLGVEADLLVQKELRGSTESI